MKEKEMFGASFRLRKGEKRVDVDSNIIEAHKMWL